MHTRNEIRKLVTSIEYRDFLVKKSTQAAGWITPVAGWDFTDQHEHDHDHEEVEHTEESAEELIKKKKSKILGRSRTTLKIKEPSCEINESIIALNSPSVLRKRRIQ